MVYQFQASGVMDVYCYPYRVVTIEKAAHIRAIAQFVTPLRKAVKRVSFGSNAYRRLDSDILQLHGMTIYPGWSHVSIGD